MKGHVKIVENHHEVLAAWAEIRRQSAAALPVWTLDYHTDTMPCFRGKQPPPEQGIWQNAQQVDAAIAALRHDEHFDWALRCGMISEAHIGICGENTEIIAHPAMHLRRPENFPSSEVILNSPEEFRPLANQTLESSMLRKMFHRLPEEGEKYIFDIDCDYILCERALHPEDDTLIRQLLTRAALVTISLERDWVRILKLPGETLDASMIANRICDLMKS